MHSSDTPGEDNEATQETIRSTQLHQIKAKVAVPRKLSTLRATLPYHKPVSEQPAQMGHTASAMSERHSTGRDSLDDSQPLMETLLGQAFEESAKMRKELAEAHEINHDLRASEQAARQENQALRASVVQLKQEISAATASGELLTDEGIGAETNDLFHELRGWAVNAIKTINLDDASANPLSVPWLKERMPAYTKPKVYPGGARTYAMNVLIALAAFYITGVMNSKSFLDLETQEPAALIMFAIKSVPDGTDFVTTKRWLSISKDLAIQLDPMLLEKIKSKITYYGVHAMISFLFDIYGLRLPNEVLDELARVYNKAADLVFKLHFHPAEYSLNMGTAFSIYQRSYWPFIPSVHEDVGGMEHEDDANVLLCGMMFPSVIKHRTERGQKIEDLVVSKAKVLTYPADA